METWKETEEFKDFEISDEGRVRHKNSGRVVHSSIDDRGNSVVFLCTKDGERHKRRISRLVAEQFSNVDISDSIVINADGDKLNNNISNLKVIPKSKKVEVVNTGDIYNSITECSKKTGVSRATISKCANYSYYKNKSGYKFKFID